LPIAETFVDSRLPAAPESAFRRHGCLQNAGRSDENRNSALHPSGDARVRRQHLTVRPIARAALFD
jgi:hypothetical protein